MDVVILSWNIWEKNELSSLMLGEECGWKIRDLELCGGWLEFDVLDSGGLGTDSCICSLFMDFWRKSDFGSMSVEKYLGQAITLCGFM